MTLHQLMAHPSATRTTSVSIVCVFNDEVVRRRCLDQSVENLRDQMPDVELIAIDNTSHAFTTAGAALNHGASLASHDIIAFAHQDVCLQSLAALGRAAAALADDPTIGMIGPVGIGADGAILGRTRDRITLIGESCHSPTDVDSLDEVLFLVSRTTLSQDPLSQSDQLAWHAYAVEYGLRVRTLGLRVCAMDIPLTHNSLTINLDKLDVAHAAIAIMYPADLPIRTTCGTVGAGSRTDRLPRLISDQRWRYRWLDESLMARRLRRAAPGVPVVLSDIRQYFDTVLAAAPSLVHVINIDSTSFRESEAGRRLSLLRLDQELTVTTASVDELRAACAVAAAGESLLLTNVAVDDLAEVRAVLGDLPCIIGLYDHDEVWLLAGPAVQGDVPQWRTRRARPLGTPQRPDPSPRG